MQDRVPLEVIVSAGIAFLMGLVRAITVPDRRGAIGFAAAIVVSISCGVVAATIARELETTFYFQYICATVFGLLGHRIAFALLSFTMNPEKQTTNFNGSIKGDVKINKNGTWNEEDQSKR